MDLTTVAAIGPGTFFTGFAYILLAVSGVMFVLTLFSIAVSLSRRNRRGLSEEAALLNPEPAPTSGEVLDSISAESDAAASEAESATIPAAVIAAISAALHQYRNARPQVSTAGFTIRRIRRV